MRTLAVAALCVTVSAGSATADTMQFGASKDNTLYEDAADLSNGAGERFFAGIAGGPVYPIRRGLVAFDVSAIPEGATIDAVRLTLYMSKTPAGVEPVALHRVLADWGEGTSVGGSEEGMGGAATLGDATWEYRFFNTDTWATDGGDFIPIASASQLIGGIGFYTFTSTQDLVADVQHWLDNPALNFGWILIGDEAAAVATVKRFDSKDNSVAENRPVLEVDFTPSTVGVDGPVLTTRRLELLPVAPNPAYVAASFRFRLAEAALVRLNVYDARGRQVADLAGRHFPAGESAVEWNAGAVPRGTYWVRIEANGVADARSFVLTRSR